MMFGTFVITLRVPFCLMGLTCPIIILKLGYTQIVFRIKLTRTVKFLSRVSSTFHVI